MLHPHTELRYVSQEIGYGIFATQDIPVGTITWVKDELDRTFLKEEVKKFSPENLENLMKYTYRDRNGDFFFCWDLNRFVNHSFQPNSMITSLDFEIAIKNILKGEEITNDYGTLNILEPFQCAHGLHERKVVHPDDLTRHHPIWDAQIKQAMESYQAVHQPLKNFLSLDQATIIAKVLKGEVKMPSLLETYYRGT
jgi:hypothetical protein